MENKVKTKKQGLNWSNSLLDGGNKKTLQEWRVWCKKNNWKLPTIKEYSEMFKTINLETEFGKNLKEATHSYWLITNDTIFNPFSKIERVVVLGVGNDWFILDASDSINYYWPAFGVRTKKK